MEVKSLENFLDKFGQRVVDKAQAKLYKEKGNTALGQSIRFEVVRTETGFSTKFYMLDYGTFLDKGVSGNKKKRSYKNYKGLKPKGFGRGRDKDTGRYLSGLAIYISHKIKVRGIPSLSFFQQPLGVEYEKLKEGMLNELKLDIESYLTTFYRPK